MNNKERLKQLKLLKIERGTGPLFKSAEDCMVWIDNIAPLLKYDQRHYEIFINNAQYVRITTLSADRLMSHLNPMIGIVDQAIFELENKIKPFSPIQAVKRVWHESFLGKVTVSVTSAIIMLFIGTLLAIYVLPSFRELVTPKAQQQQLSQRQQETIQGASNIQSHRPKTEQTVPQNSK